MDPVDDAAGYVVERSLVSGGGYEQVATTPGASCDRHDGAQRCSRVLRRSRPGRGRQRVRAAPRRRWRARRSASRTCGLLDGSTVGVDPLGRGRRGRWCRSWCRYSPADHVTTRPPASSSRWVSGPTGSDPAGTGWMWWSASTSDVGHVWDGRFGQRSPVTSRWPPGHRADDGTTWISGTPDDPSPSWPARTPSHRPLPRHPS